MKLKSGVKVRGASNELLLGLYIASSVWSALGQRLVVTSMADGKHSRTSLHYSGNAADLRTRYFDDNGAEAAVWLKDSLSDEYDVVVESDHIHIEYQPKGV